MGKFKDFCENLFITYNKDINLLTTESTKIIFNILNSPNNEIYPVKDISIGKFYIIKYNYNGNKIWCPIFVINDKYDPIKQKRIIHSINIDYMPYVYRITFFDNLFNNFRKTIEYNKDITEKNAEIPLKINFKFIFDMLKMNGNYEYTITAYDFNKIDGLKQPKLYYVSMNFIHRLIFINTKIVNLKNMKDLSLIIDDYNIKNKLLELIKTFDELKSDLNYSDESEYYRKIKKLEKQYKLINP